MRQRATGKYTIRERINSLLDPDSFLELGMLATQQSGREQMVGRYTAADGLVVGYGRIDGREVIVGGEDFTVMGGSEGRVGMLKRNRILDIAMARRLPMIWLLDGAGARTGESLRGSWVGGDFFLTMARLSGQVPQVGVAMGPCAGGPALMSPLMDFLVMVAGTSMLAAGGPPVVEAAIGEKVTKEELGGSKVHTRISGVADNEAADEDAALALMRRYLSYMPAPRVPARDHALTSRHPHRLKDDEERRRPGTASPRSGFLGQAGPEGDLDHAQSFGGGVSTNSDSPPTRRIPRRRGWRWSRLRAANDSATGRSG